MAARRSDEDRSHRPISPVAQVDLQHAEGLRDFGWKLLEGDIALELSVARNGGQDRSIEGRRDILWSAKPAIGLLAQEREAHTEHQAEQNAQEHRLQQVAAPTVRDEALLDDLGAARTDSRDGPYVLSVRAEPTPLDPLPILGGEICQLLLDVAERPLGVFALIGFDEFDRLFRIDARELRGPARRTGTGGHVHDVALGRVGHANVAHDVIDRLVHPPGAELSRGGRGDGSRPDDLDVVLSQIVSVQRGREQADGVHLGTDRLREQDLCGRLVAVASRPGDRERRRAGQKRHRDDDPCPAPQHRKQRAVLTR